MVFTDIDGESVAIGEYENSFDIPDEVVLSEAEALGLAVVAASDYYEDASTTDPRTQKADNALKVAILRLWLDIYPKEYMEAPWDFEPDYKLWVRSNQDRVPTYYLNVEHFEPETEEIKETS